MYPTSGWQATPKREKKERTNTCSTAALEMISMKRKLRKQWQISRSPELKGKLNKAVKKLRALLKKEKEKSITNY